MKNHRLAVTIQNPSDLALVSRRWRAGGYCIAIGDNAQEFFVKASPPWSLFWRDSEADGRPPGGIADDTTGGKEPEAQGCCADTVHPAEVTLKEHAEVVGHHGQAHRRLGSEEFLQAELVEGEIHIQLLDDALAPRAPIVIAPHGDGWHALGEVGHERLEGIAFDFEEFLAAGQLFLADLVADEDQSARLLPTDLLMPDFCHVGAGHSPRLPDGAP